MKRLVADDFIKGVLDFTICTSEGITRKHCTVGWLQELDLRGIEIRRELFKKMYKDHTFLCLMNMSMSEAGYDGLIASWNDNPLRSFEELADTWNEVMEEVGLIEPERTEEKLAA